MVFICSRCDSNYFIGSGNYMQYLIRHITDSTGHTFTEVIKPRENERYEIVSAESKEEALSYNEVSGDKNNISVEEMRKRLRKGQ